MCFKSKTVSRSHFKGGADPFASLIALNGTLYGTMSRRAEFRVQQQLWTRRLRDRLQDKHAFSAIYEEKRLPHGLPYREEVGSLIYGITRLHTDARTSC
jgi:hypothetical protein